MEDTSLLVGFSNRYKKFDVTSYLLDGVDYSSSLKHNQEDVASIFSEVNYDLNKNNELILSLNAQRYFENAGIEDDNVYGVKLGHMYRKDDFVQKTFMLYGKSHPSSFVLLAIEKENNNIKFETAYGVSTQSIWKQCNVDYALLLLRNVYKEGIYRNATGFHNSDKKYTFDVPLFEMTYYFNGNDKIDFSAWAIFPKNESHGTNYSNKYGGYVSLYKKLYGIDIYNSLSYVSGESGVPDGWNYDVTLTYSYSKDLSFYIKGINLFDTALKSDYIAINPLASKVTKLNNISNVDSAVWVGLEYEF